MIHLKKHFDMPMFRTKICVMVADTNAELAATKEGKLVGFVPDYSASWSVQWDNQQLEPFETTIVMMLLKQDLSRSTIVHECFHVVHRMIENLNTGLSDWTNELFANTLGYFTDDVLKALEERRLII